MSTYAVVDVHKDWCGPCKIMEPTYKRLAVDIDQSEKRVAFASVSHERVYLFLGLVARWWLWLSYRKVFVQCMLFWYCALVVAVSST